MTHPDIHPDNQDVFLTAIAAGWSVTDAAQLAGRDRRRFYELRGADGRFSAAWDAAGASASAVRRPLVCPHCSGSIFAGKESA